MKTIVITETYCLYLPYSEAEGNGLLLNSVTNSSNYTSYPRRL